MKSEVLLLVLVVFTCAVQSGYDYSYDYSINSDEEDKCSKSPMNNAYRCQRWNSCTQCQHLATITNCHCDSVCHYYGDCCPDVFDGTEASKKQLNAASLDCVKRVVNDTYLWISVISSCPSDSEEKLTRDCEKSGELLVYGSNTSLIYKNKFCSRCHGNEEYKFLRTELVCNGTTEADTKGDALLSLINDGIYVSKVGQVKCELAYTAAGYSQDGLPPYRQCINDLITTCSSNADPQLIENCKEQTYDMVYERAIPTNPYRPYIYNFGIVSLPDFGILVYRNEACAKCNGLALSGYQCEPNLIRTPDVYVNRAFDSLIDVSLLTCLSTTSVDAETMDSCGEPVSKCPHGMKYVPLKGCVTVSTSLLLSKGESVSRCPEWFNSSEYIIIDGEITFLDSNMSSNEFFIDGDQAFACIRPGIKPIVILGIVLISISLICILVQLVFYCYFRQLRNVPGFIVMSIISSLFIALLAFLVSIFVESNASSSVCVALAIIQHLAFLASFCWTNIMAFDVTRMLRATLKTQGKKRLIWYNMYAWSLPVVIVVAAILAEYLQSDANPAYGTRTCWFNDAVGLLAFFVGPLFFVLLLNVILYVAAVVSIAKAARQTKMVNPNLRERFFLCIKLVVVMGLPWLFAVARAFTENQVVSYIFVILTASQGIAIFMCFIMTNTVLNLIRGRRLDRQTTSNSTTRTMIGRSVRAKSTKYSMSDDGRQLQQTFSNDSYRPTTPN